MDQNLEETVEFVIDDADTKPPWVLLVVDDDQEIHDMTKYALRKYNFHDRSAKIFSAYSGAEARQMIPRLEDLAVILLDVVMESPDAGLLLVEHIRETLGNRFTRIILRTGQPGDTPEYEIIRQYDINDYQNKADFTSTKLLTTVTSSLRSYDGITTIERYRRDLTGLVEERTAELSEANEALRETNAQLETLNEDLSQANRFKSQMLSIAAHDLKNPLGAILGFVSILEETMRNENESAVFVASIGETAERMLKLVTDLLDTAAAEMGKMEVAKQPMNLTELACEASATYERAAGQKGQTIKLETPAECWVPGDWRRLRQVAENLVSNAVKYSPPGKTITVRVDSGANSARFSVSDEGPGLSEEAVYPTKKIKVIV